MGTIRCVPGTSLMNSMRSMGYELKTAVADVIDNSITAHATTIDVRYHDEGQTPFIAIIDDGDGMDRQTAINAMRLGGTGQTERSKSDLGRFGLGLKTASLSQARSLLVCTRQSGRQTALRWDLDQIQRTGDWSLEELDDEEASKALPRKVRDRFDDGRQSGTVVLWRKLDRLEALAGKKIVDFDQQMDEVNNYLALVFHRFLHPYPGDEVRQIRITINGYEVPEVDPFLTQSLTTHSDPAQQLAGTSVMLRAFTLPPLNKLTVHERRLLQLGCKPEAEHSPLRTQGFYIYRSYRLISWGTWFRMARVSTRLQHYRVRVDIPNSPELDSQWGLDVKKSRAVPPRSVRHALKEFMVQFTGDPRFAQTRHQRPTQKKRDELTGLWKVVEDDDGRYGFEIDDNNIALKDFVSSLSSEQRSSFNSLTRLLTATIPLGELADKMGQSLEHSSPDDFIKPDQKELVELAQSVWQFSRSRFASPQEFAEKMSFVAPFSAVPDVRSILLYAAKEKEGNNE